VDKVDLKNYKNHIRGDLKIEELRTKFQVFIPDGGFEDKESKSCQNDKFDNCILLELFFNEKENQTTSCLWCTIISRSLWIAAVGERLPMYAYREENCPYNIFSCLNPAELAEKVYGNTKITKPRTQVKHIHRVVKSRGEERNSFNFEGFKILEVSETSEITCFLHKKHKTCKGILVFMDTISLLMHDYLSSPKESIKKMNFSKDDLFGAYNSVIQPKNAENDATLKNQGATLKNQGTIYLIYCLNRIFSLMDLIQEDTKKLHDFWDFCLQNI
jgi:hypothetical protein